MNEFNNCFKIFNLQIEKILIYLDMLESQKVFAGSFDKMRIESPCILDFASKVRSIINSPIQYNALIISLYGSFEGFIDNLAGKYIEKICSISNTLELLPSNFLKKHEYKVGEYLLNPNRYKRFDLTTEKVIKNFYNLFNTESSIAFRDNICFLTAHSGNMNSKQVFDFSKDLGIVITNQMFISNIRFSKYCQEKFSFSNEQMKEFANRTIDANPLYFPLNKLVEERNNIAHGWAEDQRLSYSFIKEEIISYLLLFAEVLTEIYMEKLADYLYSKEINCKKLTKPINVINDHILCLNNENNLFKVGDWILAVSSDRKRKILLRIDSLQINNNSVNEIKQNNIDVGIGFEKRSDKNIKKNMDYYILMNS